MIKKAICFLSKEVEITNKIYR